jgi:hypothetical protein
MHITKRQSYKQTGGRKGDRQLEEHKQTHRQANTQTGKVTDRQTHRQANTQTGKHTDKQTHKGRQYSRFTYRKEYRFLGRSEDDKKLVERGVYLLQGL